MSLEQREHALVALAISGDARAFSDLVRQRQSWLRNLLQRLCHDRTQADDLAQLTLLQAWRSLRTLRSVPAFQGWLRRLAINVWLQQLRTARVDATRRAEPMDAAESLLAAVPQDMAAQLDLDEALAALSRDERLCVVLAYHEGMSHAEISGLTELPLGTVKSHIRRGAERLRARLAAYRRAEEISDRG